MRPLWSLFHKDLGAFFSLAILLQLVLRLSPAECMSTADRLSLRQQSRDIFYHGLAGYTRYAYPEDELRPLTCAPLTRDRANPAHIEVNDVLGNYSLSLVDSLSTLAILASSPRSDGDHLDALKDFQMYIALFVQDYGDGTTGRKGQGRRARGFDLDSKVQLFETTIRGLGGLLSAHLFAMGELPIRGYEPDFEWWPDIGRDGVEWHVNLPNGPNRFIYDGQLLRLAYDMGKRLLPAFNTPTGIPYPRVNLRTGIPFYENSPLYMDTEGEDCGATGNPRGAREVTETCSAGAGSLVLEFTVLSRLTGDERFEKVAKRAFWAVWERRTGAGLIGSGIDAETGQWIGPYTGIGAGIDSFFEYAFKSHILLSGLDKPEDGGDVSSTMFLDAWETAHSAILRHIYRGSQFQHPHYAQNDIWTGGPRLAWIDSLSAYYPGLLALAGEVEEATASHLLYTALWDRYGALPERWNTFTGKIDAGLRWWGGRPEFIESTWYLYRATKDPWYLHVGEMAINDIRRRCWTPCGWAGLQDVRTGELSDRMESFFLGETAKYLYLLFDEDHPLNHLDAPFVFTTEGHPLIIPKYYRPLQSDINLNSAPSGGQCPVPLPPEPFSISRVAARPDLFHASTLARLYDPLATETQASTTADGLDDTHIVQVHPASVNNSTFYPRTLPSHLIPTLGTCSKMSLRQTFDLTFPALPNTLTDFGALQRIDKGILINSVSGLRLGLALDQDMLHPGQQAYRVYALSNLALGRDESIWLHSSVLAQLNPIDPNLTRLKDTEFIDLIIDEPVPPDLPDTSPPIPTPEEVRRTLLSFFNDPTMDLEAVAAHATPHEMLLNSLPPILLSSPEALADHLDTLSSLTFPTRNLDAAFRSAAAKLRASTSTPRSSSSSPPEPRRLIRHTIPASLPTGPGAASPPAQPTEDPSTLPLGSLPYTRILVLDSDLCTVPLPPEVPTQHQILVVRRGGCSFSAKLENVPAYVPGLVGGLEMVVVVSFDDGDGVGDEEEEEEEEEEVGASVVRPHLDRRQKTASGVDRVRGVPLVLVAGGDETWGLLEAASSATGTEVDGKWYFEERWTADDAAAAAAAAAAEGLEEEKREEDEGRAGATDGHDGGGGGGGGIAIKRRYWFASNGIRIANLYAA